MSVSQHLVKITLSRHVVQSGRFRFSERTASVENGPHETNCLRKVPHEHAPNPEVGRSVLHSQKHEALIAPTVAASIAASLVVPDIAAATTLTPSVEALLKSVVAGGLLAGLILGAVTLVAGFDPITRK